MPDPERIPAFLSRSDAGRVPARLSVGGCEPLHVAIAITSTLGLRIEIEGGAVWVIDLDPSPAAYLAGLLAVAAGVWLDGSALLNVQEEAEDEYPPGAGPYGF